MFTVQVHSDAISSSGSRTWEEGNGSLIRVGGAGLGRGHI